MTTKTPRIQLTNALRTQFVNNVLADINTRPDDEKLRSATVKEAVAALPAAVAKLWADPELRPFVHTSTVTYDKLHFANGSPLHRSSYYDNYIQLSGITVPAAGLFRPSDELKKTALAILQDTERRKLAKHELQLKLTGMAAACKTLDALQDLLPDLAKYMPAPPAAKFSTSVPALLVKDVISDLAKLGVPKGKKAAARAAVPV